MRKGSEWYSWCVLYREHKYGNSSVRAGVQGRPREKFTPYKYSWPRRLLQSRSCWRSCGVLELRMVLGMGDDEEERLLQLAEDP